MQILYVGDAHLHRVAAAETLHELRLHQDGAAFYKHTLPLAPLFAEESQLAGTFKVLDCDEAARIAGLRKLAAHHGDDAAQQHFLLLLKLYFVCKFGAMRVAKVIEYHLIVVQRMGGEVDADKVALAVKFLYGAPRLALGDRRSGYVNVVDASEE